MLLFFCGMRQLKTTPFKKKFRRYLLSSEDVTRKAGRVDWGDTENWRQRRKKHLPLSNCLRGGGLPIGLFLSLLSNLPYLHVPYAYAYAYAYSYAYANIIHYMIMMMIWNVKIYVNSMRSWDREGQVDATY